MELLHYSFRLLALSQVVTFLVYVFLYQKHRLGYYQLLAGCGFAAYLVIPFVDSGWGNAGIRWLIELLASSIPAFVWLMGRAFFEDDRHIPGWFWFVWIGYLLLWMSGWRFDENFGLTGELLFGLLPQLIKLGLVVHVIFMALQGLKTDLVVSRLQLRLPLAAGAACLTALVILVEIGFSDRIPMTIEVLGSVLMFLIAVSTNIYLLKPRTEMPPVKSAQPATDRGDKTPSATGSAEIAAIETIMLNERFYARHGVTLKDLARALGMPEYRLRTTINGELGYRNFNQFLNRYRIEEASRRLLSESGLPILSIALDTGFKSLSSFNRFFKEIHGVTPSEYRSAHRE